MCVDQTSDDTRTCSCNKIGTVIVHTHWLTYIISDQMSLPQIQKKRKKKSDRKNRLFSHKFSATAVSQGVETHNKTCSAGGDPEIYQVHEPQKKMIIRHNKELSILKVLFQSSQKRKNHLVQGFSAFWKVKHNVWGSWTSLSPTELKNVYL